MVLDSMLGLPHVDWADLEGAEPVAAAPAKARKAKGKSSTPAKKKKKRATQ
jgi:beta-lactamase class C